MNCHLGRAGRRGLSIAAQFGWSVLVVMLLALALTLVTHRLATGLLVADQHRKHGTSLARTGAWLIAEAAGRPHERGSEPLAVGEISPSAVRPIGE